MKERTGYILPKAAGLVNIATKIRSGGINVRPRKMDLALLIEFTSHLTLEQFG
jgi:hypothetical protein